MKSKRIITFLILILCFALIGCSKKKSSPDEEFKKTLVTFEKNISDVGDAIDNIDPAAENSKEMLLSQLDKMNGLFISLSKENIPDNYPNIKKQIDQAALYMDQSVSLYHQAYEAEIFDSITAQSAKIQYDMAMQCISNVGALLKGEKVTVEQ